MDWHYILLLDLCWFLGWHTPPPAESALQGMLVYLTPRIRDEHELPDYGVCSTGCPVERIVYYISA
jgi:hypothetical protein